MGLASSIVKYFLLSSGKIVTIGLLVYSPKIIAPKKLAPLDIPTQD